MKLQWLSVIKSSPIAKSAGYLPDNEPIINLI